MAEGDGGMNAPLGRLSQALLRVGESERARNRIVRTPAAREVAMRFIAAESLDGVLPVAADHLGKGMLAGLEPLLATAADREQAARATRAHVELADALGAAGLASGVDQSVRLGQLGLGIGRDGQRLAAENLARICRAARNGGSNVVLDMEAHESLDATFAVFSELHQDFPLLGITIQSQLRRSLADARWLSTMPVRVRLCKGAYTEPRQVSLGSREEVDENYRACLEVLMAGRGYPMVATHDPALVKCAGRLASAHARTTHDYEIQMYYGVRPWEHRRLADTGRQLRVHLPFGADWVAYLARRVAERPANVGPLLRALVTRR